jgi:pilus assembly protein FimV
MKSWPPLGAAVLLAAPAGAWALGLGDIQLQSALNQPFRAEIPLLSATAEELESLKVGLASPETFGRYGLDRSGDLSALEFEVGKNDKGQTVVRVHSDTRIDEPFLTMLVEARWPRGRLLREYTVLLDPPSLLPGIGEQPPIRQAQTAPASTSASGAIARAPATPAAASGSSAGGLAAAADGRASAPAAAGAERGSASRASGSRGAQAAAGSSSSDGRAASNGRGALAPGGTYGPVQSDETLWGIASALRPAGVTTNQMMVALYEANPDAFLNNMNLLRRGATLQVPDLERLRGATPEAATAEVRLQEEAWQGRAEPEPRLRLVPPDQELTAAGAGSGAGGAEGAAGASTGANAGAGANVGAAGGAGAPGGQGAAAAADVAALRDQVAALQNQLTESRRLLELRDQQLQALQAQAAGTAASAAATASTAAGAAAPGIDLESQPVFADGADAASADAAAGSSADASAGAPSAAAAGTAESPDAEAAVAASADAESAAESTGAESAAAASAPGASASSPSESSAQPAASAAQPTPAGTRAAASAPAAKPSPAPSLLSRALGWIANPLLLIGLGLGAVLLTAVWYLRHRREEDEDVTGRWDALEAEIEEEVQAQTTRTKRLPEEQSMIVEEQTRRPRAALVVGDDGGSAAPSAHVSADDTLTSQTVINLDQADPVDEADFHMAYGLYDQAAELVSKALEAEPGRRDLQLKLLEVYFVWGNKDAFLTEVRKLHAEIGGGTDADWDKVLIMGKQICPDEPIFAESAGAAGALDVDLEGDRSTELDFAFDEKDSGSFDVGGMDLDFELAATGERFVAETRDEDDDFTSGGRAGDGHLIDDDDERGDIDEQTFGASLDIGAQTAAGLEAALFMGDDDNEDEDSPSESAGATTLSAEFDGIDGSAVTQESPTVESERSDDDDWAALFGEVTESEENEDEEQYAGSDAPTMETPTVETARADAPTVETPTIQTGYSSDAPTVETPTLETAFTNRTTRISTLDLEATGSVPSDHTEEIDLDDLGLSLGDLEDLPADIGELPHADDGESDTREQPVLRGDDELLSATGVTEVLHEDDLEQMETSVLQGGDSLFAAAAGIGGDDGEGYRGTEIIDERREADGSGDTSLVRSLSGYAEEGELDLNLEELSAALEGGDTVEQPHGSSFHADFFGDGATPIDLDIGSDLIGLDDPTGTEHMRPLDPQTMTEIGTKLDLARAYIDMGDPEGARSILEEVLDEGDAGQRREAQGLIDALSA